MRKDSEDRFQSAQEMLTYIDNNFSDVLGDDYDTIMAALQDHGGAGSERLVGNLNDLKSGKFEDAAHGLRAHLKVGDDWSERDHCTVEGMTTEIHRICDCPDCALRQATVLEEMGHAEHAARTRNLADALARFEEARRNGFSLPNDAMVLEGLEKDVKDLRNEMDGQGEWFYGCDDKDVMWPEEARKHERGYFTQPMCDRCRRYALDHSTVWAHFHYTVHERASGKECPNGKRDDGNENMTIEDFVAAPEAQEARLTREQTIALRFYTSNSFAAINNALRDESRQDAHPLPAITTCIANGVKSLQAVGAKKKEALQQLILWRGYKDVQVTSNFKEQGGTEFAPLSATTNPAVAVQYAVKYRKSNNCLLFRIVTDNNLQRGASLKFLSMFPGEDEILFGPLTFFQATGRTQEVLHGEDKITVIEVKPHMR